VRLATVLTRASESISPPLSSLSYHSLNVVRGAWC
jgi:hypothetical protein